MALRMKSENTCSVQCLKHNNHKIAVFLRIISKLKHTYDWTISPFQVWLVVNMNNCRQQILRGKETSLIRKQSHYFKSSKLLQ